MSVAEKRRQRAMAVTAGHPLTELDSVVSSENGSGKSRETERTSNVDAAAGDGGGSQSKLQSKVQVQRGIQSWYCMIRKKRRKRLKMRERIRRSKRKRRRKRASSKNCVLAGYVYFFICCNVVTCDFIPTSPNIITLSTFVLVLFDP